MNWNKIKPKAHKQFKKWVTKNIAWYDGFCWDEIYGDFEERHFYDFFDGQGIYISIKYDCRWKNPDSTDSEVISFWDWEIDDSLNNLGSSDVEEPTRAEAEEKAFEKAFGILENKL